MGETNCRRCDGSIDIQEDEWWSHRWEENPDKDTVEQAIEDKDFRDWFQENHILCPDCHERVVYVIENHD